MPTSPEATSASGIAGAASTSNHSERADSTLEAEGHHSSTDGNTAQVVPATVEHTPALLQIDVCWDPIYNHIYFPIILPSFHKGDAFASLEEDSAYGSDIGSANTGSITSSIFHYQYENGRRYHAYREGQYVLPNDDQEQERLNLQHHIWRLLLGGSLYTAPLPDPSTGPELRILDLGTGTGIWAVDMADEFPLSQVYGIDLSPIQPDWVPMNCRFHVDDYDDEWTYHESEKFDYIHGRALCGTSKDWPRLYQRIKDNLKPGGWAEIQEYDAWIFSDDDSCERAPWTMEWVEKLDEASRKFGRPINIAKDHKKWMIDAGYENVVEVVRRVRIVLRE